MRGGVGVERAARACRLLIDGHRPRVVISAGFAGALAADLERGCVVAPRVAARAGAEAIDLAPVESLAAGRRLTITTVDRIVSTVAEKQRLATETAADIVDMETWAVAREAIRAGVPCQCLRVVSDAATDSLPPEMPGSPNALAVARLGAALRTVGSRPTAAADLWRLYERAVVDSRTLADALEREFVSLRLPPPSALSSRTSADCGRSGVRTACGRPLQGGDRLGGDSAAAHGAFHRGGPTRGRPIAGQEQVRHAGAGGGPAASTPGRTESTAVGSVTTRLSTRRADRAAGNTSRSSATTLEQ